MLPRLMVTCCDQARHLWRLQRSLFLSHHKTAKNRNSVNLQSRTMTWLQVHVVFLLCLSSFVVTTRAQQPYVGTATTDCSVADNSTSVLGYTCNGLNKTCLSYIIFRSRPPFSTVSTVSSLFSADPSLVSSLNSATNSTSFPLDQQLIVPVTCSCSRDNYSQSDITYTIQQDDSYFSVANNTLQGLSTCQAIGNQNNVSSQALFPGMRVIVPIRCACPTDKQVDQGVNYLLSYTVVFGDTVAIISQRFGVETSKTIEANEMNLENPLVFPFTTILIPLENPPSNSNTLLPSPPPPQQQPPSASPPPPQSPGSGNSKRIWVYVLVGALVLLCILGVIIFGLVKRKFKKKEEPEISNTGNRSFTASKSPILDKDFDPLDGLSGIVVESLKVYKFQELKSATDDFNSPGESGYIGKINGDGAVIKKIEGDASNEINLLSKLNHFNIIRLSGFCFHEGDWYLVYEHASNGSLSDWIYTNSGNFLLSWIQRLQICVDIATGLNYLHNFADPPYVHKDLNSNNVLLDIEFRGKIGNLGLARSTEGEEEDFVLTKHVEGTKGYLAPEYLEHGLVSTKLDVYAFGVLMLEIVTGKEAYEMKKEIEEGTAMAVDEERYEFWEKKLGSCFSGNCPDGLESFVVKLVIDCLKRDHLSRPSMDEIVRTLSKILTASQSWDSSY